MVTTHSLAAFLANYTAGAHLIAFEPMSETFEVSIEAVANTIGIGILGLGVGPLLWSPLSSPRGLGRRWTYILAWSCYVPLLLWLCFAKTFNSFAAARFVTCFFGAVSQSVPAQQIGETFDRRYKGTAMSAWALFMTCGPVSTASAYSVAAECLLQLSLGDPLLTFYFILLPQSLALVFSSSTRGLMAGAPSTTSALFLLRSSG